MSEYELMIHKRVYERYPKTEKEKTCALERTRLEALRAEYKKRLYDIERTEGLFSKIHTEKKAL